MAAVRRGDGSVGMRANSIVTAAGLLLAGACGAVQWFAVGGPRDAPGRPLVEVDLETIGPSESDQAVIRVSYDGVQTDDSGVGFRSFVGTARFDCRNQTITLTSAAYYRLPQGGGARLGSVSAGHAAGMPPALLRSIPAADRQALLRATCATRPPAS